VRDAPCTRGLVDPRWLDTQAHGDLVCRE
jgi:hypothetical protein